MIILWSTFALHNNLKTRYIYGVRHFAIQQDNNTRSDASKRSFTIVQGPREQVLPIEIVVIACASFDILI